MGMYSIGQRFEGAYPPAAADWCMQNGAMIAVDGDGYIIQAAPNTSDADNIKAKIAALESQQTPRRLREAALTDEGRAWLQNLEDQIEALRVELSQL